MKCTNCGKKVKATAEACKRCGTPVPEDKRKYKSDKLGNCAIVFAFFIPVLGLILGIFALIKGIKKSDLVLRNDGIKAIVMSFVVTGIWILFWIVLAMLGVAAPFIIMSW